MTCSGPGLLAEPPPLCKPGGCPRRHCWAGRLLADSPQRLPTALGGRIVQFVKFLSMHSTFFPCFFLTAQGSCHAKNQPGVTLGNFLDLPLSCAAQFVTPGSCLPPNVSRNNCLGGYPGVLYPGSWNLISGPLAMCLLPPPHGCTGIPKPLRILGGGWGGLTPILFPGQTSI